MRNHVTQRVCAELSTNPGISETCTPHKTPVLPPWIVSPILQIELRVRLECLSKATQPESGRQTALGILTPGICAMQHWPPDITIHTNARQCLGNSQH